MVRWSLPFSLVVAGLTFLVPEKAVADETCPCGCGMLLSACNPAKCKIKAAMLQKQAAAEAQAKAEAQARAEKARAQAEAQARAEAEQRAREQAEAQAKAQAEAQAKAQAQAQAKQDPQTGRLTITEDAKKNLAHAQAADTLVQSVGDRKSSGECARYVQRAIEASGIPIGRGNAEDFGGENGLLRQAHYQEATGDYKKGDVVVIDPSPGHPHGHVAMYDGSKWVSDFVQKDLNPYNAPPGSTQRPSVTYKVYRYQPDN